MSVGLRPIHSVETMTWVSERSGSASICDRRALHRPQSASAAAARNTNNRRLPQKSMTRARKPIGAGGAGRGSVDMAALGCAHGAQPALGVEEELGARGHLVAGREARL